MENAHTNNKIFTLKFVRKARKWCVTYFTKDKTKTGVNVQHQEWFSTETEGEEFIKNGKEEN